MSLLPRRPADPPSRSRPAVIGIGAALLIGLLPWTSVGAASPAETLGLRPTIHYEDALEHADDDIEFTPGGRVTVPFEPRDDDDWKVDGRSPRALPAGAMSGRAILAADETAIAPAPPGLPVAPPVTPSVTPSATPSIAPPAAPSDTPSAAPSAPAASEPPVGAPSDPPVSPSPDSTIDQAYVEPSAVVRADLAARVDPGGLRREVFGFLPYWELTDSTTRFEWDKISTVAYFGVGADAKGNLMKKNSDGSTTVGWSGWTSSRLTSVIDAAHRSGARVVLTVQSFAWSTAGLARQKALLGSATARANLATQIARAVRDRGADGVNLDFEPIASGYADEFTALVRLVRTRLNDVAPGYQLTFDTTGWIGNYPIEDATAPGGADAIFIMGYDYRSSGSNPVGSIAPIGGPTYDIRDTLAAYLARVPASKLILGVPYFGRAWSTSTSTLNGKNISGAKSGTSVSVLYERAREIAADHGKRYDPVEGVAWTTYRKETCTATYGCVTAWRQLYYDDATALKAKYDLINQYDLRGVGIWALGYDNARTELYQALADRFITDTVPPKILGTSLDTTAFSPNGDGVRDTVRATLKVSGLVRWGYRVHAMSGGVAGRQLRSNTIVGTVPAITWNGRDADDQPVPDGAYRITLWAADASDNRTEKTFAVTIDTDPPGLGSTISRGFVTPDGNGFSDTLPLTWTSDEPLSGTVRLIDRSGATVRTWSYTSKSSWRTSWTGKTASGKVVKPGTYTYRVSGTDKAGNRTTIDKRVLADSTISLVRWSDTSIDPRDGERSRVAVRLYRAAKVTVAIYRGDTLVRRVWTDRSLAAGTYRWTWTGKTSAGAYVPPGTYRVLVTAKSRYGTTWLYRNIKIQVH